MCRLTFKGCTRKLTNEFILNSFRIYENCGDEFQIRSNFKILFLHFLHSCLFWFVSYANAQIQDRLRLILFSIRRRTTAQILYKISFSNALNYNIYEKKKCFFNKNKKPKMLSQLINKFKKTSTTKNSNNLKNYWSSIRKFWRRKK